MKTTPKKMSFEDQSELKRLEIDAARCESERILALLDVVKHFCGIMEERMHISKKDDGPTYTTTRSGRHLDENEKQLYDACIQSMATLTDGGDMASLITTHEEAVLAESKHRERMDKYREITDGTAFHKNRTKTREQKGSDAGIPISPRS